MITINDKDLPIEAAAKIIKGVKNGEFSPEVMFDLEGLREISIYLQDYYDSWKRREAQK